MEIWAEVPTAVLCTVAGLLDVGSLQHTRVVCKAWQQAASLAVHTLSPRVTGPLGEVHTLRPRITRPLGIQWHNMPLLSKAFPACRVLNLRSFQLSQDSGQHLQDTAFTQIRLCNEDRCPRDPVQAFHKLHDSIACASYHCPKKKLTFAVDIEMLHFNFGEAPRSRPDLFTDELCLQLLQFPKSAYITKLNAIGMAVPITGRGLRVIAHMTALRELTLICRQDIDDVHLELLSRLGSLTELKIGPLRGCSNDGVTNTLSQLSHLQKLSLTDAVEFSDQGLAHVSAALSGKLQALSFANCPRLTNESVSHLSTPHLSWLHFSYR